MEKCAFDVEEEKCSALTCKKCDGCSFYKTKTQVEEGRRISEERLDSIRGGLNLYKKYYCGESSFKC